MDLDQLILSKNVRVVVFWSAKQTFFVGADIKGLYQLLDAKVAADASREGQRVYDRINALRVPTIAALNGSTLGGGLELALACTYRVATTDRKSQIGLPETKLGLIPGCGGTVRLPKTIGLQSSLEMILPGKAVNPFKAQKMGLVDYLFEYEDRYPGEYRFFGNVRRFAIQLVDKKVRRQFKSKGFKNKFLNDTWIGRSIVARMALKNLNDTTRGKYPAPYKALESVMNSYNVAVTRALDFEANAFGKMATTPESKNLMSIFFLQEKAKKIPKYLREAPSTPVKNVCVIGAGVMGAGIAQLCAHKGMGVYMKDIEDKFVNNGMKTIEKLFQGLVKKGSITSFEAKEKLSRVKGGTRYDGVKDSEIIIEAAVEKMDIKKQVLQSCEDFMKDESVVFATNTSTLSITELATASRRPENVVGMHFFNPVHKMPLVEIIRGEKTSDYAVKTTLELALKLGKVPVIVKDGPGFLVNRVLGAYLSEAGRMLTEGADIQHVDKVILNWGMPMGPFRLMDEVGFDVVLHSSATLKSLGPRFGAPMDGIQTAVKQGILGRKSGQGFFVYNKGKKPEYNLKIDEILGKKNTKKISAEDIIDRCMLLMVNEAALILEEGIAASPEDVDIGMVFGIGFAPFRGGLLNFADQLGVKNVVKRLHELETMHGERFKPCELLLKMASENAKFFPNRPQVLFVERRVFPRARL